MCPPQGLKECRKYNQELGRGWKGPHMQSLRAALTSLVGRLRIREERDPSCSGGASGWIRQGTELQGLAWVSCCVLERRLRGTGPQARWGTAWAPGVQGAGPSEPEPGELWGEAAPGVPAGGLERQACPWDVPPPPPGLPQGRANRLGLPRSTGSAWKWTLAMGVPRGYCYSQKQDFVSWVTCSCLPCFP